MCASAVLPVPGGPKKTRDVTLSASMARLKSLSFREYVPVLQIHLKKLVEFL